MRLIFKWLLVASIIFSIGYTIAIKYFSAKAEQYYNEGYKLFTQGKNKWDQLGLFKKACFGGIADGCLLVGTILVNEALQDMTKQENKEKMETGYSYFLRSCSLKKGTACFSAGIIHRDFFESNRKKWVLNRLYSLGCSYSDPNSCNELFRTELENGKKFEDICKLGEKVYALASEKDYDRIKKDHIEYLSFEDAFHLFTLRCFLNKLDGCMDSIRLIEQKKWWDAKGAIEYYQKACDLGGGEACFLLAEHWGKPTLKRACQLGYSDACI